MQDSQISSISNFIWGIADSFLRGMYSRGKYRDVILPMTVIRRLDAVLEPTKQRVLDLKKRLDEGNVIEQAVPLCRASGQQFYNAPSTVLTREPTHPLQSQIAIFDSKPHWPFWAQFIRCKGRKLRRQDTSMRWPHAKRRVEYGNSRNLPNATTRGGK